MISIKKTPTPEMERRWKRWRDERQQRLRRQHDRERTFVNYDLAMTVAKDRRFWFRGREYGVPPIPWNEGASIARDWADLNDVTAETPDDQVRSLCVRVLRRWHKVCRPVKLRHRIFYRLRNPFMAATHHELMRLQGFFLISAMSDAGAFVSMERADASPSTSPTSPSGSPGTAQAGPTEVASRSPGSTSRSGAERVPSTSPKTHSTTRGPTGRARRPRTTGRSGRTNGSAASGGGDE